MSHIPVLLNEVLYQLNIQSGMSVIDGTFGSGGHTRAFLAAVGPSGKVLGLDKDESAIVAGRKNLKTYKNLTLVHASFDELEEVVAARGFTDCDALLLDLGFSSLQLDAKERGFSFQQDGPLDMRLDITQPSTAREIVNRSHEKQLTDIFFRYGDLYDARRIAKQIVEARQRQPILTTGQLVQVLGLKNPGVLAKVFQALRIAVNDEMGQLERVTVQAVSTVREGGRIGIISFHSLEDRLVKQAFKTNHRLQILTKKPLVPSAAEVASNPRSRSAKLRVSRVVI